MMSGSALFAFVALLLCSATASTDFNPFQVGTSPASAASEVTDRTSRDEITSLPGFDGELRSKHHAGFLTVDLELGNHLYYYFVESENSPSDDPLVLWLNGGPGCSSFDGFVYELGPFKYDFNGGDVKLKENPYAWSKIANMIFLDSPAGTGLSYCKSDFGVCVSDDVKASEDLHTAVLKFMELFPEYASHKFFIAGESYAGIYIPMLVERIVKSNEAKTVPYINLKAYLIGNPYTDIIADNNGFPSFAYGKSLISRETYDILIAACDGKFWRTIVGSPCHIIQRDVYLGLVSVLNVYDVARKCEYPPAGWPAVNAAERKEQINSFVQENGWVWPLGPMPSSGRVHNWRSAIKNEAPCTDYWTAEAWFNREDVRKAIHAAPIDVSGYFYICTDSLEYDRTMISTFHVHERLIKTHGMHALIYSGDHDMRVPHTGTVLWVEALELPVVSSWRHWMDPEYQVGGFHVEYENLTYCTVRNAGHMVPQTNPMQALEMFRRYLTQLSMHDQQYFET